MADEPAPQQPVAPPQSPEQQSQQAAPPSAPSAPPTKKPRLPRLVTIFSVLFFAPFTFLMAVYAYLVYLEHNGTSGTEYIGILLAPVALAVFFVSIVYVILLLLYANKKYAPRKRRILSLIVALLILGFYGLGIVQAVRDQHTRDKADKLLTDSQVLQLIDQCKVESVQKHGNQVDLLLPNDASYDKKGNYIWQSTTGSAAHWDTFVAEVRKVQTKCGGNISALAEQTAVSWISVQEATDLLQKCEITTFNYSPSAFKHLDSKPKTGTDTGIILEAHPIPKYLYIEPSAEATMIPIAYSVEATCHGPYIWHDGKFQQ
jgi:hypothetical protein